MEQLLVNLKLLGLRDDDLSCLPEYVETVADAVGVTVAPSTTPGPDVRIRRRRRRRSSPARQVESNRQAAQPEG